MSKLSVASSRPPIRASSGRPVAAGDRYRALVLAVLAFACAPVVAAAGPEFRTADVERFYALYAATDGQPSAEQLDSEYLAPGTDSLKEFAQLRRVTGERMAAQIRERPEIYENARSCLEVLPNVERRLTESFATLSELYPEARFPPVAIVVGRGRPVGIVNPSGVTIGLEALCAADFMNPDPEDRFVYVVAHEYAHIQQTSGEAELEPGDPAATVLRMSLAEGAAEFVAELISGGVGNAGHAEWTRGREDEIESAFVRDMDSTDLSAWMYDYRDGSDEPYDLGYWVGYRIVKAYYQRADDKQAALARIFEMEDPKAFLRDSGWEPGMTLGDTPVHRPPGAPHGVGFAPLQLEDPVAGGPMAGTVWYPSDSTTKQPASLGLHRVDAGSGLQELSGRRPLVVISHGQGGDQFGHHTLATHLAAHGFLVATLTHPRDNPRDGSGVGTSDVLFGRPLQVQALISHLLASARWGGLIDPGRIGAAGFSDGGYTALLLAGGVPRFDRYADYCRRNPGDRDTCEVVERLGGSESGNFDGFLRYAEALERARQAMGDTADARIRAVFAMAPTSLVFDEAGAGSIRTPVFLYYGEHDTRLPPSENALHLEKLLRVPVEVRQIPKADHWVFLPPCTEALAREVPLICNDPPGVDRRAVHTQVNAEALDFFTRVIGSPRGATMDRSPMR